MNYWKTLLLKFNSLKTLKHSLYNLNKFSINTYKNKFFDNTHFVKKNLEPSTNNLVNYNNYIITHNSMNSYLSVDFLKDLVLLNFIQTLVKIYEIYKILVILLFIK